MGRSSRRDSLARLIAAALALWIGGALAAPARAGTSAQIFESVTGAPGLDIDPSIRSAGMGGATTAVFWGVDPNHWANAALLGSVHGIRYEEGTTDDAGLRFLTQRTALGTGGLGFAAAGQPFDGMGGLTLDFPEILGSGISSSEHIRSWAMGASLAGLSASIARLSGRDAPAFTRYADVALGYAENGVEDVMAGGGLPAPTTVGRALVKDWGLLVRGAVPVRLGAAASGRLEGAYGFSAQNFTDASMDNAAFGVSTAVGQDFRNGVALHLALDPAARWDGWLPAWLAPGLAPLVSLGGALDAEHTTRGIVVPGGHDVERWGGELGLANVVFVRAGRSRSDNATAAVDTWGYGIGLPLGRYGGYRYDHAVVLRPPDLPDLPRDSWTAWLDPVEIVRALRR